MIRFTDKDRTGIGLDVEEFDGKDNDVKGAFISMKMMSALWKLADFEDLEEELGFELTKLFDAEYEDDGFIKAKEDGTIYFCGDAYYGIYSLNGFLRLIKELLSAYRQAKKNLKKEDKE